MKPLRCNIPTSLHDALTKRVTDDQSNFDVVVSAALSTYLQQPIHTLFQVSTSAALVEGLYQGAVQVSRLLRHGDFGLGTFVDLEGEMVVLDGVCYQVSSTGVISTVGGDRLIPYAVVTRFAVEKSEDQEGLASLDDLVAACDRSRDSDNMFYAFRVQGNFASVKTRVMKAVHDGAGLKDAVNAEEEFAFGQTEGTLVGIWSPNFAGAFSVPGYHFHFLSKDLQRGGHLLACHARNVRIQCCSMHEMHVCLPETAEFLRADLSKDPTKDLAGAEKEHSS